MLKAEGKYRNSFHIRTWAGDVLLANNVINYFEL